METTISLLLPETQGEQRADAHLTSRLPVHPAISRTSRSLGEQEVGTFLTVTPAVPRLPHGRVSPSHPTPLLVLMILVSSYGIVRCLLGRQVPEHFTDFTAQGKEGSSG